jgi:hypothetical protein
MGVDPCQNHVEIVKDKLEQGLPRVLMSYVSPLNATPTILYIIFTLTFFLAEEQTGKIQEELKQNKCL